MPMTDPYMEKLDAILAAVTKPGAPIPAPVPPVVDYEWTTWTLPTEQEFKDGPKRLPMDENDTEAIGECARLGRTPTGEMAVTDYADLKARRDWFLSLGNTNPPYFWQAAAPYPDKKVATTGAQQAIAIIGTKMSPGFDCLAPFSGDLSRFNDYWLKQVYLNAAGKGTGGGPSGDFEG